MNKKRLLIGSISVLSGVMLAPFALAAAGDVKVSTSYKAQDVEFRPGSSGVASDTDSETTSLAVSYEATDLLTLTGTYSDSSSRTNRDDGVRSDTDSKTYGITAAYKLSRSLTAFGNYTYGDINVDSRINPNSFFDLDLDLNLYLAGITYAKVFDRTWLMTITPTISYADSDISDYIIRNANTPVEGSDSSVTTLSVAPSVSYILGKALVGVTYTQTHKNRGEDKAYGKVKLGANYRLTPNVSLSAFYAEDVSKDDIEGQEFQIKAQYAF